MTATIRIIDYKFRDNNEGKLIFYNGNEYRKSSFGISSAKIFGQKDRYFYYDYSKRSFSSASSGSLAILLQFIGDIWKK